MQLDYQSPQFDDDLQKDQQEIMLELNQLQQQTDIEYKIMPSESLIKMNVLTDKQTMKMISAWRESSSCLSVKPFHSHHQE